jgi:hypothetical protein
MKKPFKLFIITFLFLVTQKTFATNHFFESDTIQKTKEFTQIGQADLFAMADALEIGVTYQISLRTCACRKNDTEKTLVIGDCEEIHNECQEKILP